MRRKLTFDPRRCLACRGCELACALAHAGVDTLEAAIRESPPPARRVRLEIGPHGLRALRCDQCDEPLCAFSCKSGALSRDPLTGRIALDAARCLGCWMCVMV